MVLDFFKRHVMPSALLALVVFAWPAALVAQEETGTNDGGTDSSSPSEPGGERRIRRLGDVESDEWEMDLKLPPSPAQDATSASSFDLPDPEQHARLQQLLSSLATRPGNNDALRQLDEFLQQVLDQAHEHADRKELQEMQQLLLVVRNVNPHKAGLSQALTRLQDLKNIDSWILSAQEAIKQGSLIEPEGRSALYFLDRVVSVDPQNEQARSGYQALQNAMIETALRAAHELDFDLAEEWLYEASQVFENQETVDLAREQVLSIQTSQASSLEKSILEAISADDFDYAEFILIDLVALIGNDRRVSSLREKLRLAKLYGHYNPGQILQDPFLHGSGVAPAIVVIKSGSFMMGSPDNESGRAENEGPQHRVTFAQGFAIGLQEVTVGQFRQFATATGFRTAAEIEGKSRAYDERLGRITDRDQINWTHDYEGNPAEDNLPALHLNWYDAQAYVKWLSEQTGHPYRLPSEAEFEYATRGGTVSAYWWGDERPEEPVENLTGTEDTSRSGRQWSTGFRRYGDGFWGPAPGASFPPNSAGLHDMAGNVSEWVQDCWHATYVLAPVDGTAWDNPGCKRRVARGGYWASAPEHSRSASRLSAVASLHGPTVGFRIARDL